MRAPLPSASGFPSRSTAFDQATRPGKFRRKNRQPQGHDQDRRPGQDYEGQTKEDDRAPNYPNDQLSDARSVGETEAVHPLRIPVHWSSGWGVGFVRRDEKGGKSLFELRRHMRNQFGKLVLIT